jgi:hypothetical protein
MSYDLAVFDPAVAPAECAAFMVWYEGQTAWSGDLDYDDPANASPPLRRWYESMRDTFPPMNGPDATDDDDDPHVTGYAISLSFIYADFRWSLAEEAYEASLKWAREYRLGFFDVSATGDVWLPVVGGDYRVMNCGEDG